MAKTPRRTGRKSNAPGRGHKVSTELKARFREAYLRLGIVAEAAREVRLPPTTCRTFAEEAESDPAFVQARRSLLTRGLDRVETMVVSSAEIAYQRIAEGPKVDDNGSIVDPGPNYMRGLVEAHRSLVARRKTEHDMDPDKNKPLAGPLEIVFRRAERRDPEPSEPTEEESGTPDAAG